MARKNEQEEPHTGGKKNYNRGKSRTITFSVILVLLPLFLLLLFEGILRLSGYGDSYQLFTEFKHFGKSYKTAYTDYGKKYFSQLNYTHPPNDIFLKEKPDNGFRIFVIGSSTAAGFPYNVSNSFSRILQQRLQDSYPDHYVEVINIAITAINSYSFYDMIDQILKEQPDALLIYAGHNEFYGAMGIASIEGLGGFRSLKLAHLKLLKLRVYQLTGTLINKIRAIIPTPPNKEGQPGESLMESIARHKSIEYESHIYKTAHEHYEKNMGSILKKANNQNVTVLFSEVVGNIKDLEPFVAVNSELFPSANEVFNNARQLEKSGDIAKAKELYYQAKDLDGLRFRASEDINRIIHKLSKKYHAIPVPMKTVFENHSPENLIGNNLLTEHVHPNIDGYFLMADAFYNILIENDILGELDSTNFKPGSFYRQNWGFTPLDSIFTQLRLQQLLTRWPFVKVNPKTSFLDEYTPVNKLDSLAMRILRREVTLGDAYRLMVNKHERNFQFQQAYEYVLALARMNPHNPENFIRAGDLLLLDNNYDMALYMYITSLRHTRQLKQLYKTGEIYLELGQYGKAELFFKEALHQATGDVNQLLTHLLDVIAIKKDNGETGDLSASEEQSFTHGTNVRQRVVIFAPTEVTEKLSRARHLIREQSFEQALNLLYEANRSHETPVANRYIGELYLHFGNREALTYLQKAYPEHSSNTMFITTYCYAAIMFDEVTLANNLLNRLQKLDPENQRISMLESKLQKSRKP